MSRQSAESDSIAQEAPFAILGAGQSGRALESFLRVRGLPCTVFDEGSAPGTERPGPDGFDPFGAVVLSPGFSRDHPWRRAAERKGGACFAEMGFAARLWRGPIYGVTGTNGKSTVTALLQEALCEAGRPALAVGNIGRPFTEVVHSGLNDGRTIAVCEISSFQAEISRGLRLDGLIWTNFAEDHLDRYASMEEYFLAKASLFAALEVDAPCIIGPGVAEQAERQGLSLPSHTRVIGKDSAAPLEAFPGAAFAHGFQLGNFRQVHGFFRAAGLPEPALFRAANAFKLADHRLSLVAEEDGLRCWNDSKATNFDAALAALEQVGGCIHWIGGGRSKGGDLAAFARSVASKTARAYLYGEVAAELAGHFENSGCRSAVFPRFEDAVAAAFEGARADAPASLLLSPGFASFDQFSGYSERGNSFVSTVLSLMHADPCKYSSMHSNPQPKVS